MDLLFSYFIKNLDKENYRKRFRALGKALDSYSANIITGPKDKKVKTYAYVPPELVTLIAEHLPYGDIFDLMEKSEHMRRIFANNWGGFWGRKFRQEFGEEKIPEYFMDVNNQDPYKASFDLYEFSIYEEVAVVILEEDGMLLRFVSDELKNNPRVVLTAVKENGLSLQFVTDKFKNKYRYVVKVAVKQNGLALQYVTDKIKGDLGIVHQSVKQNGLALQYAHPSMRTLQYSRIVETAVRQNGLALQYTSDRVKDEEYIVRMAIRKNPQALQYASQRLQLIFS